MCLWDWVRWGVWPDSFGRFLYMYYEESGMGNEMTVISSSEEKYLSTLLIFISIYLLKPSCHSLPKHSFFFLRSFSLLLCLLYTHQVVLFSDVFTITWFFLFSHTSKIVAALRNTGCASAGVNLPSSIFQFTQAEMSLFGTDPTCSGLDQVAAGPRVWFLPCVERGKIRIRPQEPSFEISGLFAFPCCWLHYCFCRSCHFKPFF